MPTIDIKKKDLEKLIGRKLTGTQLENYLMLAKAELKEYNTETDDLKVELSDSNRPDLWSSEGIARQLRNYLSGKRDAYPFLISKKKPYAEIFVSREMKSVRPYIASCAAFGLKIDEDLLVQMIQSQDKLSDIYGRKRQTVSIGIYELDKIVFPVNYRLAEPESIYFTPLGMDEKLNLREILYKHPKGIAYGSIVKPFHKYPILLDSNDQILSFPPIINSRETGEVKTDTGNILIEVTGTDIRMVMLTINILSTNLYDRGAKIEPIMISYPYQTELGKKVITPYSLSERSKVSAKTLSDILGEDIKPGLAKKYLVKYGHKVSISGDLLTVWNPPYRDDIMHPVDIIEDLAISRGYNNFKPELPKQSTVGGFSDIEILSDHARDYMVGSGFQEILSNILGSPEDLRNNTGIEDKFIEIENVMSLNYSVIRNYIIPSLLRVEAASSKAFYPHRTFEVGEVVLYDGKENLGSQTKVNLGVMVSHTTASFSETHSYLDLLLYYLGISYQLEPSEHPLLMSGRCGNIIVEGKSLGFIGEINPAVLDRWEITMPCAAFEINLDSLILYL